MPKTADQSQAQTATLVDLGAIFVSLAGIRYDTLH
jgi:transposase